MFYWSRTLGCDLSSGKPRPFVYKAFSVTNIQIYSVTNIPKIVCIWTSRPPARCYSRNLSRKMSTKMPSNDNALEYHLNEETYGNTKGLLLVDSPQRTSNYSTLLVLCQCVVIAPIGGFWAAKWPRNCNELSRHSSQYNQISTIGLDIFRLLYCPSVLCSKRICVVFWTSWYKNEIEVTSFTIFVAMNRNPVKHWRLNSRQLCPEYL